MKKCPYCSEEIQDDAIKCKHCGEWLEKKSDIKSFFSKAKSFVEEKRNTYKEKKTSHLYVPTEENPLIIESIRLYPDRFEYGNKTVPFNQICHIDFYASSFSINGISTGDTISFTVFTSKGLSKEDLEKVSIIDSFEKDTLLNSGVSRKTKQQILFMKNILSKMTLNIRLVRYLYELQEKKYFTYDGIYRIHENGDIEYDNKIKANIKEAYDNDLLVWGSSWSGLKSSSFDPFEFIIYKSHGPKFRIAGIELSNKTKINTTLDTDVFDIMMLSFLKSSSFHPEFKENAT